MKKLKVGVLGAGSFAVCFIPLFKAHPGVSAVAVAERVPERLNAAAGKFGITETHASFEELLSSDCDAIAIFTQRETHAPFALRALRAGKHVYCAVPAGMSIDEIAALEAEVRRSGLTYMLGETSYYYPSTLFCRSQWRRGLFGRYVYGEGEYMHDMGHGFYEAFRHSGGPDWKRVAGLPPMFYPTHTASMLVSVTGARLTSVSCLGQVDDVEDGVFRAGANHWDNRFSNQTALFRTSDGGMFRMNEFRRIGHFGGRSVRLSLFGTAGCYEEQPHGDVWVNHELEVRSVAELLRCEPVTEQDRARRREASTGTQEDFYSGMARIHPSWRLPESFAGLDNGHHGSHQFLVDDFVRACREGLLPPNHIWAAARYNIPGFVAHQSALREGESLQVPDLGDPPKGVSYLEDRLKVEEPASYAWTLPPPLQVGEKYWLAQAAGSS